MGKVCVHVLPVPYFMMTKNYPAGVRRKLVQPSAEGSEEEGYVPVYNRTFSGVCMDFSGL